MVAKHRRDCMPRCCPSLEDWVQPTITNLPQSSNTYIRDIYSVPRLAFVMSFVKTPSCPLTNPDDPTADPSRRPKFNSQNTQDRLREGEKRPFMFNNIKKNRKSVFREVGLASEDTNALSPRAVLGDPISFVEGERHPVVPAASAGLAPLDTKSVELGCTTAAIPQNEEHSPADRDYHKDEQQNSSVPLSPESVRRLPPHDTSQTSPQSPTHKPRWYAKLGTGRRPRVRVGSGSNPPTSPLLGISTMTMFALAVAVMAPTMLGRGGQESAVGVADAGVIAPRATSPTDVCARWAQQSK